MKTASEALKGSTGAQSAKDDLLARAANLNGVSPEHMNSIISDFVTKQ
jgi:hypothetical protein